MFANERIAALYTVVLLLCGMLSGCNFLILKPSYNSPDTTTTTKEHSITTTLSSTTATITTTKGKATTQITQSDNTTKLSPPTTTSKQTTVVTTTTTLKINQVDKNDVPTAPPTQPTQTEKPIVAGFTPLSQEEYYGYSLLKKETNSATLTRVYNRFVNGVENMDSSINLNDPWYPVSIEDAKKAWNYYVLDYPQHFWINGQADILYYDDRVLQFDVEYTMSKTERNKAKGKFDAAVKEILSCVAKNTNDFERELTVHDILCDRITYKQTDDECFTAYGALINNTAVCEGYAESFQYLMYQCGIQCLSAIGVSGGAPHKWNIIRIDGNYYHVDATWDDPVSDSPIITHNYFNLPFSLIARDHTVNTDTTYPLPTCTATNANYFKVKGGWMETLEESTVVNLLKKEQGKAELFFPNFTVHDFYEWFSPRWEDILTNAGFRGKGYSMSYSEYSATITVS